ncbi:MAG TPA: hypothetical protein VLK33_06780 [Terriglobales bacterium]|nr:hypothetical protein [Terriglobales bacterium]
MKLKPFLYFFAAAFLTQPILLAQSEIGDENPTGVAGTFNGEITTGGMYDPYTANAKRVVDDIIVPGSVGSYPLKWTRYWNSHQTYSDNTIGGHWRYSYYDYKWQNSGTQCTPDGRENTGDYGGRTGTMATSLTGGMSPIPFTITLITQRSLLILMGRLRR